jgi:uncharacterized protein with beta-barrel porin domain
MNKFYVSSQLQYWVATVLCLAVAFGRAQASAPPPGVHSPEYTVIGNNVVGSGMNTTTAVFGGDTGATYNLVVLPGANLGNVTTSEIGIDYGNVTNFGTVSSTGVTETAAIYIGVNGRVVNYGRIVDTGPSFNQGVYLAASGEVDNFGSIFSSGIAVDLDMTGIVHNSELIVGGDTGIFANNTASIFNTGTVIGGGTGIQVDGNNSIVVTSGGLVSGGGGGGNSIFLAGIDSRADVVGRARLIGPVSGQTNTGNVLNLDLAGVTPTEAATIRAYVAANQAMGSFTVNGSTYSYTGFDNGQVNANPVSLERSVDRGLLTLAQKLDTTVLPQAYDPLFAAAYFGPEGALNEFVGREIDQGIDTNEVNQGTTLAYEVNNHLDEIGVATGGFDLGGLQVSTSSMLAFAGTDAELDSLMNMGRFSGTEMSTDTSKDMKQMVATPEMPRWGAWASGTVTLADASTTNSSPGYQATTGSPTLGIDYHLSPTMVVGALVNYSTTGANFGDGSYLGAQTGLFGLYTSWHPDKWRLNAFVAGGYTSYDIARTTFGGTANAHPSGSQAVADVTGGYDIDLGHHLRLTPELGLTYTYVGVDSYTEGNAGAFDLSKSGQDIDSLRSHIGGRLTASFPAFGGAVTFLPELRASYYHEFLDDSRGVTTSLPGAAALGSFAVQTQSPERDFALVGVGLSTAFTGAGLPMAAFLNYDVQAGQNNYIAHNIDAGLRVSF